jgi:DNA-binding PadR family transcriptional regulator
MRRTPGVLLPLEQAILAAAMRLRSEGVDEFHGFAMAKQLVSFGDSRRLTSHGTLYKVLDRLETAGLLESRWEDPAVAARDGRPRRRLYTVTGAAATALAGSTSPRKRSTTANRRLATR